MKGILIAIVLGVISTVAYSQTIMDQDAGKSKPNAPVEKVEQLKKESKAPDRASFATEEEYLKAKEAWVKKNHAAYEQINQAGTPKRKED